MVARFFECVADIIEYQLFKVLDRMAPTIYRMKKWWKERRSL